MGENYEVKQKMSNRDMLIRIYVVYYSVVAVAQTTNKDEKTIYNFYI